MSDDGASSPGRALVVGVDVGGTFTDVVPVDEVTGAVRVAKVPTTTSNQADSVLAALAEAGATPAESEDRRVGASSLSS